MVNGDEIYLFRSFDQLWLEGTFLQPADARQGAAVLVHGGGVDRNEGGFYVRLAEALASANIASLRFDMRVHGRSEGRYEEMTLLGIVNDIHAAVEQVVARFTLPRVHLIGTSFGGGLSAYFAARFPETVLSLVLMNPLLDYKRRLLEEKPLWQNDRLTEAGGEELRRKGWIPHTSAFGLSRALINELFYISPHLEMSNVTTPVLTIHGTADSVISFTLSEQYAQANAQSQLLPIEGADHGFSVPGDDYYADPRTLAWQQQAIRAAVDWVTQHNER